VFHQVAIIKAGGNKSRGDWSNAGKNGVKNGCIKTKPDVVSTGLESGIVPMNEA